MASYKGVSVPIEGHVEKIYISSKMSIENVKKILDSIDFNDYTSDPFEMLTYVVAVNENTGEVLAIDTNCTHSYRSIYILDKDYNYTDIYADGFFVDLGKTAEELYGKSGWLKNITEIEFNSNLSSYSNNIISQVEIGGQNDKLSGLFSIKPIIEEKNILMHPKDEKGNSDKNVSLFPQTLASNLLVTTGKKFKMPNVVYQEGSLQSTIVPNTGPTGEIYFNTNLNVEEVINIFKNSNLTFYEHDFLGSSYGVFISNNTETGIFINDWGGGWDLVLYSPSFSEPIILFSNVEFGNGVIGWSPDLISNNRMDFSALNEEYVSSLNGVDFGHQNERLSMLVGATPFQKTIEGLFIAKEDGTADESKPLSLGISEEKVNELIDNKVTDNVEHTPVPNSGLIKNVYFNTSLTAYEVALKLNELTYIETQLYPYPINILFATEDFTKVLVAVKIQLKYDAEFMILEITNFGQDTQEQTSLFSISTTDIKYNGWQVENKYYITLNKNLINDYMGLAIGAENNLLSNVISLEPYLQIKIDKNIAYGSINPVSNRAVYLEFEKIKDTHNLIDAIISYDEIHSIQANAGDKVKVLKDETKDFKASYYIYNGYDWEFYSEETPSSITTDNEVIEGSANPVSSGAVAEYVKEQIDTAIGDFLGGEY